MNGSMVARDASWCRSYGKRGKGNDAERRALKRKDRNKHKRDLRRQGY